MRIPFFVSIVSVCLATVGWAEDAAQPAAGKATPGSRPGNAAVVYWQAFAALPVLTPDEQQQLEAAAKSVSGSVPADVQALIQRDAAALEQMHRAATAAACDWELDYAEGPELTLSHLSKLRELGRVAKLRARLRLEAGDLAGGVDDLMATLKMARDAAVSPLLISLLVGASIETPAVDLLAENLPQLDRAALGRLQEQLAGLPASPSVADCVRLEKQMFGGWLAQQFAAELALPDDTNIGDKVLAQLDRLGLAGDRTGDQVKDAVAALGTVAKLRAALARLGQNYEAVAQIAGLKSAHERIEHFDADLAKTKASPGKTDSDNWLSLQLVPALGKVIARETQRDVRRELLRLAIRAQRDGQQNIAAAGILAGGTLKYEATGTGFELRYRETPADAWESLRVGPSAK